MSEFGILDLAGGAMAAGRSSLEYLARNVAAASVAGPNGYQRFVPSIALQGEIPTLEVHQEHQAGDGTLCEMFAVLDAQRAYESNSTIFTAGKRMIEHTLDLERA